MRKEQLYRYQDQCKRMGRGCSRCQSRGSPAAHGPHTGECDYAQKAASVGDPVLEQDSPWQDPEEKSGMKLSPRREKVILDLFSFLIILL